MNNKNENETLKNIGKIILSILLVSIIFAIYIYLNFAIYLDGNWNTVIIRFCFILASILFLISIWNSIYRKKTSIIGIIIFVFALINYFYYVNYSNRIEPLIYLHNKYKYNYSDMQVVNTQESSNGGFFGEGPKNRGATIKYDKYYINVYYLNNWEDDLEEQLIYFANDDMFIKNFNSIINTYTDNSMVIKKENMDNRPYDEETYYEYIIYLQSSTEEDISAIIEKLDTYIKNIDSSNIMYDLNIIKSEELYNKIKSIDKKDNKYIFDILQEIGYMGRTIDSSFDYNKKIIINNEKDNIVFLYGSEKRANSKELNTHFKVIEYN